MKTAPRTPETRGVGPPAGWNVVLLFPLSLQAYKRLRVRRGPPDKHFRALMEKNRNNGHLGPTPQQASAAVQTVRVALTAPPAAPVPT